MGRIEGFGEGRFPGSQSHDGGSFWIVVVVVLVVSIISIARERVADGDQLEF